VEELVKLSEVLERYRPESWGGIRGETWPAHAWYLWSEDAAYLFAILLHMQRVGWFHGPLLVDDDVVQNGHHRVVAARALGLMDLEVPVEVG
jgi:hypothetical protein